MLKRQGSSSNYNNLNVRSSSTMESYSSAMKSLITISFDCLITLSDENYQINSSCKLLNQSKVLESSSLETTIYQILHYPDTL